MNIKKRLFWKLKFWKFVRNIINSKKLKASKNRLVGIQPLTDVDLQSNSSQHHLMLKRYPDFPRFPSQDGYFTLSVSIWVRRDDEWTDKFCLGVPDEVTDETLRWVRFEVALSLFLSISPLCVLTLVKSDSVNSLRRLEWAYTFVLFWDWIRPISPYPWLPYTRSLEGRCLGRVDWRFLRLDNIPHMYLLFGFRGCWNTQNTAPYVRPVRLQFFN